MHKAKTTGTDRQDLRDRLLAIGRITFQLEHARAVLDERLNAVREEHAPHIEDLQKRLGEAEILLHVHCEDSRDDLLSGRRKSLDTLFGRIGWRRQGDKIVLQKGVSGEAAAERIAADTRPHVRCAVRTKKEPDRQALKALLADGRLDPADLKPLGLRQKEGRDDFYYDLDRTELQKHLEE